MWVDIPTIDFLHQLRKTMATTLVAAPHRGEVDLRKVVRVGGGGGVCVSSMYGFSKR